MKTNGTKKAIIIFSILIVIVLSAILVAFATGNTRYPSLSDPNGVFYQRLDADGNVVYTITNQELFEEIKGNDGVSQTLLLIDSYLLKSYLDDLTDEQIQTKITELTYGTADPDDLATLDDETKTSLETTFTQSMILAGYENNQEAYASIVLARELFARDNIDENGEVTGMEVASEYVTSYFEDIKAIRIRFTSLADAKDVMKQFNLLTYNTVTLREYLGYVFTSETLLDDDTAVVEAYTTVTPYYFDASGNILDLTETIIYTKGTNDIYTKSSSTTEYTIDGSGNLVDVSLTVIIPNTELFDSLETAEAYKETNTVYYTVSKVDAFDENEDAVVKDRSDNIVYTIDSDGKIYDTALNDVTDSTDLIVNKVYTSIDSVSVATLNNSTALTNSEVLKKYIQMYNYVYGGYRDLISETASADTLLESDNPYLTFTYEDVYATQTSLATYMFRTLDLSNTANLPFSVSPKAYAGSSDDSYYLVYKLDQENKVDLYGKMTDLIEDEINLPAQTVDNLTLPLTGWFDSKIAWSSEIIDVIANDGTVTLPDEDTPVELNYTITVGGVARTGSVVVTVLASGTTSTVVPSINTEPTVKSVLNDPTVYSLLYNQLVDEMVYGTSGETNVTNQLILLRNEYNLQINDYYLAMEYADTDGDFVINEKGDKVILASVSGRIGDEETSYAISADDFLSYTLTKNPGLYILYASQVKEQIFSTYFQEVFGDQTNISKNKSDKMDAMYQQVQSAKDYYIYLSNLYAQYGMALPYENFSDYAYMQYKTKTEAELLNYFIQGVIQPYMINEAMTDYDLIDMLFPTVSEYYDNYFSLNVTHIVIYLDFDEDGTPDSYNDYIASLNEVDASAFESMIAQIETAIDEYDGTYTELMTEYEAATRDDATWGSFKQAGIMMLTETLNQTDEDGISHSVTYSGDYGVKDSYVPEYVEALINLYQEYQLEQNLTLENMIGTVSTDFGYHVIKVTKGDDFDQPSAAFTEDDSANPEYSVGSENESDEPTLAQIALYAQYFFYSTAYDLSDADVEITYDIEIPNIPASVSSALKVYFDPLLQNVYVLGTVNVVLADYLVDGEFVTNDYTDFTSAEIFAMLTEVHDVYYDALFAEYED
ncbi:MAG: hypothetical protein KKE16_03160 [Firmicutes bacterium]|nr:hypothetical protein [Bacillota bacterium]